MKKTLFLVVLLLLICGCEASYTETTGEYKIPPELSDCRIFKLNGDASHTDLWVVRCSGGGSVTWREQQGKSSITRSTSLVEAER